MLGETLYRIAMRKSNVECDLCGTPIYRRPSQIKRQAGKFCSTACRNKVYKNIGPRGPNPNLAGENNPAWRGGNYVEPDKGYRMIRKRDHPRSRANGYVLEHILVMEAVLGRPLLPGEEVHHKDHDRANNDPANLKLYASHAEHWMKEHYQDVASARDAANSKKSLKASPQPSSQPTSQSS